MSDIPMFNVPSAGGGELTSEMRERLLPEYLNFYDKVSAAMPRNIRVTPQIVRANPIPGEAPPVPVQRTLDIEISRKYTNLSAPKVKLVVFWPPGERPDGGRLPCYFHIHGGGWVTGTARSEMSIVTQICAKSRAVVVSVDYRLAPEDPFPACIEDCWEALQWVVEDAQAVDGGVLGIDRGRIAMGGGSAGGHLSAVMSHMLVSDPQAPKNFKLKLLSLIIPTVDATSGIPTPGSQTWNDYPSWTENKHAPMLDAAQILWFRNFFIPSQADRLTWYASPILAPEEHFKHLPPTHITVAELDPLRDEGLAYGKKCSEHGVKVTTKVYLGVPHPAIVQDAVISIAAEWVQDLCDKLKEALWQ